VDAQDDSTMQAAAIKCCVKPIGGIKAFAVCLEPGLSSSCRHSHRLGSTLLCTNPEWQQMMMVDAVE